MNWSNPKIRSTCTHFSAFIRVTCHVVYAKHIRVVDLLFTLRDGILSEIGIEHTKGPWWLLRQNWFCFLYRVVIFQMKNIIYDHKMCATLIDFCSRLVCEFSFSFLKVDSLAFSIWFLCTWIPYDKRFVEYDFRSFIRRYMGTKFGSWLI